MNKKLILFLIIIIVIVISIVMIINNNKNNIETGDIIKENNNTNIKIKSVVLYFSATGNTEKIATKIQKITNSDIIKIIPKKEYTTEDLNYNNNNSRANIEQNDINSRPAIENEININDYDIIYLGYPIWWGDVPKILLTLLDNYNFDNKTVIPFCTSGSSSITQSMNTLKTYNKNINWLEGKRFSGTETEEDITKWLNSLNLNNSKGKEDMYIKINDKVLSVTLENNSSALALIKKLKESDVTIDMRDYSNFEKVGSLGFDLPRNDKQITTEAGDVILYQGNSLTIYYDTNSWNFTKLGHINNISQNELKQILGPDNVTITLSLNK